jgi:hypothetical protein
MFMRWPKIDPGLVELRAAAVTMTATLVSFGWALIIEHFGHQHVGIVVLAVMLAVTFSRTQRSSRLRDRLVGVVILPAVALGATEVGTLMGTQGHIGDWLFVVAVSCSIWIRRFGPLLTRLGTIATLPFIAILVTPVPPTGGGVNALWSALVALLVVVSVGAIQFTAERTCFSSRVVGAGPPATATAAVGDRNRRPRRRLHPSTRMAVQMGCALGAAFLIGRHVYPMHWNWTVLTAFIVCSGNRGRADVVYKSILRAGGAAVGTAVATGLAGQFAPGDKASVVLIFVMLALATWLRSANYAYWAGCVTGALAMLYGYFGESSPSVLGQRLEGILVGATLGVVASWAVLPVKTTDVLRRRNADVLAVLTDILVAVRDDPTLLGPCQELRFDHALRQLEQVAPPLRFRRWLTQKWCHRLDHADAIEAITRCGTPVRTITRCARARPHVLTRPDIARINRVTLANVVALRRALAGRTAPELRPLPARHDEDRDEVRDRQPETGTRERQAIIAVYRAVTTLSSAMFEPRPCTGLPEWRVWFS